MHETDDVLHGLHGLGGDDLGALGAAGEHRIDVCGIRHQPLHLGVDRAEPGDGKIKQTTGFVSQKGEAADIRKQNYKESVDWYNGIVADVFG